MSRALAALGVVAGVALGTWLVGWWSVPLVGFIFGWLQPALRPWRIGLASGAAWAALLSGQVLTPAFPALLGRVGGIFHLPPLLIAAAPPVFAGLLAWTAAVVGDAMGKAITGRHRSIQ